MFKSPALTVVIYVVAILVISFLVLGDRVYKNDLVNTIVERVDLKDVRCQEAVVALGSECPKGCEAKPPKGPEELRQVPECRSRLWVATCSIECQPRKGLVRLAGGEFVDSSALIVTMSGPSGSFMSHFDILGVELHNGISGLHRYRARFENNKDSLKQLRELKERIEGIPGVIRVEYSIK